ncbi:MAG: PAS domain S-box protein [Anaerolineae bacterium]|nr:PAS domain S-box protein [Anaerolineae bacterium]MCB9103534.1 PAS domain S-box protein [Anaerolineales bacterium]
MSILSHSWTTIGHKFIEDALPNIIATSPWWQSWWFYPVMAGLVLALFWLIYAVKDHQLRQERAISAKLRISEERFSKLFHSSPVALAMASIRTGKIIQANSVWCQLIGYSRTEVLGRTVVELGLMSQATQQSLIDDVLATGAVRNVEFTFRTRSNQQRTILASLEPFKIDGEPTVLVTVIDITERQQIEEVLREKERHLEEAQALAKVGSWAFYPELQNGVWSKQMFALFGLDPAQGTPPFPEFLERVHPDDRSKVVATNENVIQTGYTAEVEYRTNPAHGPIRHLAAKGHTVYDEHGQLRHVTGTVLDITERKQAEETLHEQEHFISTIANTIPALIYVYDMETQSNVYANVGIERLLGYTPEEIQKLGSDVFAHLSHPDDLLTIMAFQQQVAAAGDGDVLEIKYRMRHVDESWRTLHSFERPFLRNADGSLKQKVGVAIDITAHKQAEEAVQASENKYRTLFERTTNAIFVIDQQTSRLVDANNAAVQLSGRPLSDLRQLTLRDISPTGAEAHLTATPIHQSTDFGRITYVRPDGSQRIALLNTVPLDDETLFSIARDITHEVNLEEQFRQAQKLEAIGRLAGGIAHDFNNLLVPIIGYAELGLMTLSPNDALYTNLDHIRKAAERAADLTRQILAFGRRQILELHPLNLNEIIADFQKMAQRLMKENIELHVHLDPALAYIEADKAQIDQILMNLIINAGDAMPTGGKLTIETTNVMLDEAYLARYAIEQKPGPYVMLAVSDTGQGMDAETRKHIFEPFFTTKERGQGTGLGLATIFGIVKQHQGHIWVYSEPEQGTTFKIYLPRSKETSQPFKTNQKDAVPVYGTETILVVEDEKMVRDLVCETLTAHGYYVLEAGSPTHALQLAADYPETIHLLLTDVIMPHMNGRELHQKLIALKPQIKTLYMSGYTENVIVHHGILDSNIDFLPKPFTVTDLTQKVRLVLAL